MLLKSKAQDKIKELGEIFQKAYELPDSKILASYEIHILNPEEGIIIEKINGQIFFTKISLSEILSGNFQEISNKKYFPLRFGNFSNFQNKLKKEIKKKGWILKRSESVK